MVRYQCPQLIAIIEPPRATAAAIMLASTPAYDHAGPATSAASTASATAPAAPPAIPAMRAARIRSANAATRCTTAIAVKAMSEARSRAERAGAQREAVDRLDGGDGEGDDEGEHQRGHDDHAAHLDVAVRDLAAMLEPGDEDERPGGEFDQQDQDRVGQRVGAHRASFRASAVAVNAPAPH